MGAKLRSWWQKIKQHPVAAVLTALFVVAIVLVVLSVLGYIFNWDWAGLGPYISSPHPNGSNFQRGKTLWDWLQLLIIPAVLAVGGFIINLTISRGEQEATKQRAKIEREIAEDNQREAALQTYIDKMSELLLEKKLRDSKSEDEVRKIARVRTLTVLTRLDKRRKRSILQFLYESGLIKKDKYIIDLQGADLNGADLSHTDLRGADLSYANLSTANLRGANLEGADLEGTHLEEANLISANLEGANLSGRILRLAGIDVNDPIAAAVMEANLTGAQLDRASLMGTRLVRAKLSRASLVAADLYDANLMEADLTRACLLRAYLNEAHLQRANLFEASLHGADLEKADLSGANLEEADLGKANLRLTNLTIEQLNQARSLKGATLPDGSTHP